MINLSDYSCDKCAREFSRHCKYCLHTAEKPPTKFKKKKTGRRYLMIDVHFGDRLKYLLTQICGKLCDQADYIVKQIDESGFEKPTLVIKLFSDESVVVYINEESEENQYIGGTQNDGNI